MKSRMNRNVTNAARRIARCCPPPEKVEGIMESRFADGMTFEQYLETVEENRDLWLSLDRRVRLLPGEVAAAERLERPVRLLALSEDWCGDAVNTLPIVAALAVASPMLEFRVLERDSNLDIMDAHLTNGNSRSIPIVIAYDPGDREIGWWGPRPQPLQEWVTDRGLSIPSAERYREVRRWYARDRGRTTIREILRLVGSDDVDLEAA